MKNLENLLKFEDFDRNWKAKEQKKTKKTEVGVDISENRKWRSIRESEDIEDDDIIEDDEIQGDDDLIEDSDWQEQLKTLIDEIVEGGEEPEEILEFIADYLGQNEDEDDEDDLDDIDEDDLDSDEEVLDDDEGSEVEDEDDED